MRGPRRCDMYYFTVPKPIMKLKISHLIFSWITWKSWRRIVVNCGVDLVITFVSIVGPFLNYFIIYNAFEQMRHVSFGNVCIQLKDEINALFVWLLLPFSHPIKAYALRLAPYLVFSHHLPFLSLSQISNKSFTQIAWLMSNASPETGNLFPPHLWNLPKSTTAASTVTFA